MNTLDQLVGEIIKENKLHASFLDAAMTRLTRQESEELNAYLDFLLEKGIQISYIAECYNLIVRDTRREQIYFKRKGKYRYTKFSEVSESVYYNEAYMKKYMYGLALSAFLWESHLRIHRWFLDKLPKQKRGTYLEIGPGHGYYMMNAMKLSVFDYFEGVDLSPSSVELTKEIIKTRMPGFDNYDIVEADFLKKDYPETFDAVVMGEVLEHVEQPALFLNKMFSITNEDAFIYVTTVINAPAVDHIYLFGSVRDIETMIKECGFKIKKKLVAPVYDEYSLEENLKQLLPINVAFTLRKE